MARRATKETVGRIRDEHCGSTSDRESETGGG